MSKTYEWDQEKNQKLTKERGLSFEMVVAHIEAGGVIDTIQGKGKFQHQKHLILEINHYLYIVPCVENAEKVFLKTIIPSRKMTKKYLFGGSLDE